MNPLVILFLALSVFGAGSALFAKHEMNVAREWKAKYEAEAEQVKEANRITELSEKTSNENQKRLSDLNRKLSAVRMHRPVCIHLSGTSAGRFDDPAEPGQPVRQVVISSAWADELIAEGDTYRSQLIELQEWCGKAFQKPR